MNWVAVLVLCGFVSVGVQAQQGSVETCLDTPGVNIAFASHRASQLDFSYLPLVIPKEQLLPGIDWLLFFHGATPSHTFMYPPGWRPAIIPTDPMSGDAGVRLDAPDGSAALETFLDFGSTFSPPRGRIPLEDFAHYAITRMIGDTPYRLLCSDSYVSPQLAAIGYGNLFAAVATGTHYVVVAVIEMLDGTGMFEPSYSYLVYAGPIGQFESLLRRVFAPVVESFPKGGGGGCSCEIGEPDRDRDGTCDRCDDYPDDPNRQ